MFHLSFLHFRQRKHLVRKASQFTLLINVIVHIFAILLMILIHNYLFSPIRQIISLVFTRERDNQDQILCLNPFLSMIGCKCFSFRSSSFPFRGWGIGIDHMKYNKILAYNRELYILCQVCKYIIIKTLNKTLRFKYNLPLSLQIKRVSIIPTQYYLFPFLYFNSMKSPSLTDACSNLTRYFELQRHLDNHTKRIKNAQPTLRVAKQNITKSNPHIKKQPLAEFNRIMTIDIENKALLKKLTDKSPSRIGKERPYKITKNNSRKYLQEYKQKQQNEGLMKRIRLAKSSYLNMKFASERRVTERYINTISKFGYKNFTPNKTIMMPFYKKAQLDMKIQQKSMHMQNQEPKSNVKQVEKLQQNGDKQPQIDTIVKVEKKQWQMDELTAEISYIEWVKKVTIQINTKNEDQMNLTIPKEIFIKNFDNSFRTVHRNIKYDLKERAFYLDLPKQINNPV